jgi:DNA-binding response OmpR family regulator
MGMKILLVDDNSQLRNTRAVMLSTHGYEVDSVSDTTEACLRWHKNRPDLVLLALSKTADRTFTLCPGIRDSMPAQRIGFLLAESQYLCPVFLEGGVILKGEGPEDFLARVQEMLSGVRDLPARQGTGCTQSTGEQL